MHDLVITVATLGIADSVNPVTIAVALYLASTKEPRSRLAGFVAGVFVVYLLGGLMLLFAVGGLVAGLDVPGRDAATLGAGAIMLAAAVWLWVRRARWSGRPLPERALQPGLAVALGAAVTAIDLPTAFPYFGAIAAIASAGTSVVAQVLLLVLFNALYVLPLVLILAAHAVFGARSEPALARVRAAVERRAPQLLAIVTLAAGCVLVARGASGLID